MNNNPYQRVSYNAGINSPKRVSANTINNHNRPGRPTYTEAVPQYNNNLIANNRDSDRPLSGALSKLSALSKVRYLNPLARLEYQEREAQVYTKISKQTREQAVKKIKAFNQLANFEQDEFDEDKEIDDLLEFKFGKVQNSQISGHQTHVYFEKEAELPLQPKYCTRCDQLYYSNEEHTNCYFEYSMNPNVRKEQVIERIDRLYQALSKLNNNPGANAVKKILVDVGFNDDRQQLAECANKIQKIDLRHDQLLDTMAKRALVLIKDKGALKQYMVASRTNTLK